MDDLTNIQIAPRPYRFLARLALFVGFTVLFSIASWFVWRGIAQRRLHEQLDAFNRIAGPTVGQEDESIHALPDSDNAAVAWRAAMSAMSTSVWSPRESNQVYKDYPPFPAQWWTDATASEQASAAAFPLAEKAAQIHDAQWLPRGTTGHFPQNWSSLIPFNQARALANKLADSALLNHLQQKDEVAIERVIDILHLAAALDQDDWIVCRLVSIGIRSLAYQDIFAIAPELNVGDRSGPQRQRIQRLIAELSIPSTVFDRTRTLIFEERRAVESMESEKSENPFLGPMIDMASARGMQRLTLDAHAALQSDAAAAQALYANDQIVKNIKFDSGLKSFYSIYSIGFAEKPIPRISRLFDQFGVDPMEKIIRLDWFQTSKAHAAATALAIRMFLADHENRWPAQLGEIVHDELAALPTDDTTSGSPPIGYLIRANGLPDGSDRPMLFFGQGDLATASSVVPNERQMDVDHLAKPIHWIDLKPWPNTTAPVASH